MAPSSDSPGGLFGLGDEPNRIRQLLFERLLNPLAQQQLPALRRKHSLPVMLSELEAWVWLGTVLAERQPVRKQGRPKGIVDRRAEEIALKIEALAEAGGQTFDDFLSPAVRALERDRHLIVTGDRTANRKRIKRAYMRMKAKRAPRGHRLVLALMGQKLP